MKAEREGEPCCPGCSGSAGACACCEGIRVRTPLSLENRPGLDALSYRVGTHGAFLASMLARLSAHALEPSGTRPLAALRTLERGDLSIALLDACALAADVLSFYQERIANEGFLRTAAERRSVIELARLIGYTLRPGVAASTYLAFTIDDNTRVPVQIPAGARAQSVPGPDELPQSFETVEPLQARASWNRLRPRQTRLPAKLELDQAGRAALYLAGIGTQLKPGDPLLIVRRAQPELMLRVHDVKLEPEAARTRVELQRWHEQVPDAIVAPVAPALRALIDRAPQAVTARRVAAALERLTQRIALSPDDVSAAIAGEVAPELAGARDRLGVLPAPNVRGWLAEVEAALGELRALAPRAVVPPHAAPPPAPPLPAPQLDEFAAQLAALAVKPSQPLASALQLKRSLKDGFKPWSDAALAVSAAAAPELREALPASIANWAPKGSDLELEVYALRLKTGLYGRAFGKKQVSERRRGDDRTVLETIATRPVGEWEIVQGDSALESSEFIYLDGSREGIVPDSYVVLDFGGLPEGAGERSLHVDARPYLAAKIKSVDAKVARAEYGGSGESTRIGLSRSWMAIKPEDHDGGEIEGPAADDQRAKKQVAHDRNYEVLRHTAVYLQSERLELAPAPLPQEFCAAASDFIELDALYLDLEPGRFLIVEGERRDVPKTRGVRAVEAVMVSEVLHDVSATGTGVPLSELRNAEPAPGDLPHTFVRLDRPLSYCYARDSVVIHGNVVRANHGESQREILGSGDAGKALQSFGLKQAPLTHVAAATAQGAQSTLRVYVDGVRWYEQPSLLDLGPHARAFVTRRDDADQTAIVFGDGKDGARLPAGTGNVAAEYRKGLGKAGNVRAGQISLLSTRPLGVREVINPLRASGGAERESRDRAKQNAPLAVRALDRLVSVRDYEDFARGFAGIDKASAVELSDGARSLVHVTVAGADDIPIDPGSELFRNLDRALRELGDPLLPLQLAPRELVLLVISARIRIEADRRWELVAGAVRASVLERFGFERRALGEDVGSSAVISAMARVPGVVQVVLDVFGGVGTLAELAGGGQRPRTPEEVASSIAALGVAARVPAELARRRAREILPAQLALLSAELPATLILNPIE